MHTTGYPRQLDPLVGTRAPNMQRQPISLPTVGPQMQTTAHTPDRWTPRPPPEPLKMQTTAYMLNSWTHRRPAQMQTPAHISDSWTHRLFRCPPKYKRQLISSTAEALQQPKILNFRLRRTVSWPPSPLHAKLMCECTWLQISIRMIAHNKIILNIAN